MHRWRPGLDGEHGVDGMHGSDQTVNGPVCLDLDHSRAARAILGNLIQKLRIGRPRLRGYTSFQSCSVPAVIRPALFDELPRYTVYVPGWVTHAPWPTLQKLSGCEESFASTSMVTCCAAPGWRSTFCHPTRRLGDSPAAAGNAR